MVSTDEPRKKESVATQTPGRTVKSSKNQQESTTSMQILVSLLVSKDGTMPIIVTFV
jgi:hypothetical protein